jgi:L-ascorbate 6-phosphate lactonase
MINLMDDISSAKVGEKQLAIFWLGQNSFVFKTHMETLIAVDPFFSRPTPTGVKIEDFYVHVEPPVKAEQFKVDYVFCTHDHLDHTDPSTLSKISEYSPRTVFLGPPESYDHFLRIGIPESRARSLKANETVEIADFMVSATNSLVGSEKRGDGKPWTTHYGFIFDFGFVRVYNMGDSSVEMAAEPVKVLEMVVKLSPEIAILPIVGDFPERKPEDAFRFARILKSRIVIPSHYGCFKNRTIDPEVFLHMFRDDLGIKPIAIDYMAKYIYS